MKLRRLYCSNEDIFPEIPFHGGFNVVFARVRDPSAMDKDSHNLGKTFLISVIDFCLLAGVDGDHPFRKNSAAFGDLAFCLQVATNDGKWVAVRRKVTGRKGVSVRVSDTEAPPPIDAGDSAWTYPSLGVEEARSVLDGLVGLSVLRPYDYRKGLGYCLRSQADYENPFLITRFSRGKDRDWKPYVGLVLGFDHDILLRKYDIDSEIEKLQEFRDRLERSAGSRREEYDEVRGLIQIRDTEARRLRQAVDGFSFRELEAEISETAVNEIEARIAALNDERYTIDIELAEIAASAQAATAFDVSQIRQVFEESNIALSGELVRGYQELLEFNRRIAEGRSQRLADLRAQLSERRASVLERLRELDDARISALSLLQERRTLEKYRGLQGELIRKDADIAALRQRLAQLDHAATIEQEIAHLRTERDEVAATIEASVRRENQTYDAIRGSFAEYVHAVLSVPALLSVSVNKNSNLDFHVRVLDRDTIGKETEEAEGTSYKKLLCACYDLAVLSAYTSASFFRFVYHDGIFEGLDNRKKVRLLDLIRRVCASHGLQYILTVIDSDLPRDERDQKLLFTRDEVIRELHDGGDDGRLFRMPAF